MSRYTSDLIFIIWGSVQMLGRQGNQEHQRSDQGHQRSSGDTNPVTFHG